MVTRSVAKPLLTQTVADLMTEAVVLIPRHMSLQTAARLLAQHQVSGAPVVDTDGVCVGVLSATDFVRLADRGKHPMDVGCAYSKPWQIEESEELPEDAVDRHMTANPVIVSPNVRITELARLMVDAHIHRVLIADELGRPKGIVSSTDLLAALAAADPARATCSRKEP